MKASAGIDMTWSQYRRAISTVLSVEPESTRMTSVSTVWLRRPLSALSIVCSLFLARTTTLGVAVGKVLLCSGGGPFFSTPHCVASIRARRAGRRNCHGASRQGRGGRLRSELDFQ